MNRLSELEQDRADGGDAADPSGGALPVAAAGAGAAMPGEELPLVPGPDSASEQHAQRPPAPNGQAPAGVPTHADGIPPAAFDEDDEHVRIAQFAQVLSDYASSPAVCLANGANSRSSCSSLINCTILLVGNVLLSVSCAQVKSPLEILQLLEADQSVELEQSIKKLESDNKCAFLYVTV